MRIRCESCATVYELDEKRLPARGAQVKCTRCQHVFRAVPPGSVAAVPSGVPGDSRFAPAAPPAPAVAPAPAAVPVPADAGRPVPAEERTAVFDFSRGTTPEQTASYVAATPPAPTSTGAAEARVAPPGTHRPSPARVTVAPPVASTAPARWPWILLVVLLLAAALAAAWFATRKRADAAASSRPGTLESLLARDDRASLERVASRASPEDAGDAAALRSLAMLWLAADARDELAPLRERIRTLEAQSLREGEVRAPGWERRRDEIALRLGDARREAAPIEERGRELFAAAAASEEIARKSGASPLSSLRVKAVRQAILGDPALGLTVREAARLDASDPWVEMARSLAAGARGESDLAALGSLVRPESPAPAGQAPPRAGPAGRRAGRGGTPGPRRVAGGERGARDGQAGEGGDPCAAACCGVSRGRGRWRAAGAARWLPAPAEAPFVRREGAAAQSSVATPTTRLPAGAVLWPTWSVSFSRLPVEGSATRAG